MKESSVDRILSEKLKAFREMQVTKFKFQKWKEYYLSRKVNNIYNIIILD